MTHPQPNDAGRNTVDPGEIPPVPNEQLGNAAPIVVEDVTKRYGDTTALADVSLRVEPGHFHGLVGPNGSGKTTLGRIAVGLTAPTSGSVTGPTDDVGFSFQEPRYYPSLSARENLVTFARASGVAPESAWLRKLSEALRLDRVAHQPARELSGGFEKKLDLAIALLSRPAYLWLDEPLSDLDDLSVARVVAFLDAYVAAGGGVVVSTHDVSVFGDAVTHVSVFLDGVRRETRSLGDDTLASEVTARYRDR